MPVEASVKTQGAENRSHPAAIRVYDEAGNVIETHEQAGRIQRVVSFAKQLGRFREDSARKKTCRLAVF